jgi:radical SAM superfamily enzyme YgiQ (UPF0313 family)
MVYGRNGGRVVLETHQEHDVVILTGVSHHNTDYQVPAFEDVRRYANVDPLIDFFRPIGPYRIRTFLEYHGFSTKVVDYVPFFTLEQVEKVLQLSITSKTKVLALSTTFTAFTPDVFTVFDNIILKYKSMFPNLKVICAGPNPTTTKMQCIDMYIIGYGENAILSVLNSTADKVRSFDGIPLLNGTFDYGFPDEYSTIWKKEDNLFSTDVLSLEIGRGCIFKCAFCSFPLNGKKKNDYIRDAFELRDELMRNYETFGITRYNLTDDTFNDSSYKLEHLLKVFSDLPFDLRFTAFVKPELVVVYPEQIDLLVELGMESASWGIESLSGDTRKVIHKGYDYFDKIAPAMTEIKEKAIKRGITHYTNFYNMIVGLPGESEKQIYEHHQYLINSYECDGMDFFALGINNKDTQNTPLSPIDLNPEKYGYKVRPTPNPTIMVWRNEHMSLKRAQTIAKDIMIKSYKHTKLSGWASSNLWNTGFDVERHFIESTGKWNDIQQSSVEECVKNKQQRISSYIEDRTNV